MIRHRLIPLIVVLVLGLASAAWAGPPTEQLRTYTDQVVKILQNPSMTLPDRREAVRHLAEEVFELPARVAHAQTMSGLTSAFENPQFSAAIGLIKYAQAVQIDRRPQGRFGRLFGKLFTGMRS